MIGRAGGLLAIAIGLALAAPGHGQGQTAPARRTSAAPPSPVLAPGAGPVRPARAVAPSPALEVAPGAGPVRRARAVSYRHIPPAARPAWDRFLAIEGGRWQVLWDADTGVPSRVFGSGIAAPGSSRSAAAAERAARQLLVRHIDLLAPGARPDDFVLATSREDFGLRTVGFVQRTGGVPVLGGQVSMRFRKDRIVLIASEVIPDAAAAPARQAAAAALRAAARPGRRAEARRRAAGWIGAALGGAPVTASAPRGPLLLPLVRPGGGAEVAAVLEITVRSDRPLVRATVWVDAITGAPVARRDDLRSATGALRHDTPVRWPGGARAPYPAALADVTVDGAPATTGEDGSLAWPGDADAALVTSVTGARVDVVNAAGAPASAALTLPAGGEVVWSEADDELADAQLTTFVHAGIALAFAATLAPDLAWLAGPVQATVNLDGSCNAFSDGDSVYLLRAGDGCGNTGRIPDIVYHELGHSLHRQVLLPGVGAFDDALSEGVSDYLAASLTGDPAVARGFFDSEAPLRHIDPPAHEASWPDDIGATPHATGLIIAGALWDLRTALVAELGAEAGAALADRLYLAVLERAVDIPSSYAEVLAADDDDGDLSNGTPHACAIDVAFGAHGLADPLAVGGVDPPVSRGLEVFVPVTPPARPCPALEVASVRMPWRLRGTGPVGDDDGDGSEAEDEAGELVMEAVPGGFRAVLPEPPAPAVVEYQLHVELASGTERQLPANPADPWYQLFHGETEPLYCTTFATPPTEDGWVTGAVGGAPPDAAIDEWGWGEPIPHAGSGDPPRAYSGNLAFGTDLGRFDADGAYEPDQVAFADLPPVEVPDGARSVRLQYRRWLVVEDGSYDRASIAVNGAPAWSNLDSASGSLHHRDREWRFHDVDLTDYVVDGMVEVRFELASDASLELGGWSLDNVCVVAVPPCPAGEAPDGSCAAGEDAGPAAVIADDGGCGCGAGGSSGGRGALPLLVAALFLLPRQLRRHAGRVAHERAQVDPQDR